MISDEQLIETIHTMVKCDRIRLIKPNDVIFVVIGTKRNTADDPEYTTYLNGERYDHEYYIESIIASGKTPEELIKDVHRYNRLSKLTFANIDDWEEIFSLLNKEDDGEVCS